MKVLIQITDDMNGYGYPWVWKTIPMRTESICPVCGQRAYAEGWYPAREVICETEKGTRYPDALANISNLIIVSDRVLRGFYDHGVTGFTPFPIVIGPRSKKLQDVIPPVYWHLRVDGRCELDLEAMGLKIPVFCDRCYYSEIEKKADYGFVVKEGSWDGSDLFLSKDRSNYVFCSQRVFDLAKKFQWTNFEFTHAEDISSIKHFPRTIPYIKGKKPPTWER